MGSAGRGAIGLTAAVLVSVAAPAVAWAKPEITSPPTVSGAALVGSRLEAVGAAWTGSGTLTTRWRWLRCQSESRGSCRSIDDAVDPSYTVTEADLGKRLRV